MDGGPTPASSRHAPHLERSRKVLEAVFGPPGERSFRVEFWDGSIDGPDSAATSEFTLRLRHPGALRAMLLPPTDRSVGEAFVRGDIDIDGDLEAAVRAGWERVTDLQGLGSFARLLFLLGRLPRGPEEASEGAADEDPAADDPAGEGGDGATAGDGSGIADGAKSADASRAEDLRAYGSESSWRARGPDRDLEAVRFHYDLGNAFFRLFLDDALQYSCAYFASPEMSLEEAQRAKVDLVCRKLRLRSDQRLLDIGCGWGGLVIHAAREYGVEVTGITLSREQAEWGRRWIREEGLEERCRIRILDYRELANLPDDDRFDRIASVGMIEHVGLGRYPDYFGAAYRALRPGGLFLNHGIVTLTRGHTAVDRLRTRIQRRFGSFFHRYIFPEADLAPLGRTLVEAEKAGFEIRDVESLREHYARTLRAWVGRLEARWDEAVDEVGRSTARAWRFYMGASAHLFASGYTGVVQSLLARPDPEGRVEIPSTRDDLLRVEGASAPRSSRAS